jgi:hypothetical protein
VVAAVVALQAIANVMFAASVHARLPGGTVEAAGSARPVGE